MGKYFLKIFKFITNVLLFILMIAIFFVGYSYYQLDIKKCEYIDYFGYTFFEVASGSMEDSISVGDIVIIKLDSSDIETGDVITYKSGNDFITHRVIQKKIDSVVTKGDANSSADGEIKNDAIVGKVVYVIRDVSVWKKVFTSSKVILSFAITFVLFGIYFWFVDKDVSVNES